MYFLMWLNLHFMFVWICWFAHECWVFKSHLPLIYMHLYFCMLAKTEVTNKRVPKNVIQSAHLKGTLVYKEEAFLPSRLIGIISSYILNAYITVKHCWTVLRHQSVCVLEDTIFQDIFFKNKELCCNECVLTGSPSRLHFFFICISVRVELL